MSARAETDKLLEMIVMARNALCEYACHVGPDVPCKRSAYQCQAECGKEAGDALVAIDAMLAERAKAGQP